MRRKVVLILVLLISLAACSQSVTVGDNLITPPDGIWVSEQISNQPLYEGETCYIPGREFVKVLKTSTVFQGQGVVKISFKDCQGWTLINNFKAHISGGL